jgi:hypothetical protein
VSDDLTGQLDALLFEGLALVGGCWHRQMIAQ